MSLELEKKGLKYGSHTLNWQIVNKYMTVYQSITGDEEGPEWHLKHSRFQKCREMQGRQEMGWGQSLQVEKDTAICGQMSSDATLKRGGRRWSAQGLSTEKKMSRVRV